MACFSLHYRILSGYCIDNLVLEEMLISLVQYFKIALNIFLWDTLFFHGTSSLFLDLPR